MDALLANAGRGLGKGFLDQHEVRKVVDTNITGTIYLLQKVGRDMRNSWPRPHPDHRLDRWIHSGNLASGL